ncbi:MAG: HDOD domain-containing protein [Hahellaceae bacterium]|nr:HDOD domain-containing protein [Hahellaceae bacterium]
MIRGLDAWVSFLERQQLPVLAHTLQNIMRLTEDQRTSVNLLSEVILKDPDLCSEVLKLANSVCFNPSRKRIDTISRAVMAIGFESVKSIVVSALLVDQLSNKGLQQQVFRSLATSVHAAVQAKAFAAQRGESARESVFLAALLYGLGETALWASGTPEAEKLLAEWQHHHCLTDEQQRQMLGTTFVAISKALTKSWKLGSLLEQSFGVATCEEASMVQAGVTIARLNQEGWNTGGMTKSAQLASSMSGTEIELGLLMVKQQREHAAQVAQQLGIPLARKFLLEGDTDGAVILEPDFQFQLHTLQALCSTEGGSHNELDLIKEKFDVLLKGLNKGVGLERAALFIGRETSEQVQLYRAVGIQTQQWKASDPLALKTFAKLGDEFDTRKLKGRSAASAQVRRVRAEASQKSLVERAKAPFSGQLPALVMVLPLPGPLYALLYADRLALALITEEQERNFQLLAQQFMLFQNRIHHIRSERRVSA